MHIHHHLRPTLSEEGAPHHDPDRFADGTTDAVARGRLPELRGYQREAVDAVVAALVGGGRGQVRAACGSGKSIVGVHAGVRLCPSGLVVVAVPSLTLLAQTLDVWVGAGAPTRVLAVCGDGSVADDAVRVVDLPCPVTTNPGEIAEWVRQPGRPGLDLVLVTHRSAEMVGRGLDAAGITADLLIVDEAHHTAGWAGKHGALVHRDEHLPARRRLYMSATPRLLPARRRAADGSGDVLSMDEASVFGPVCYTYPFSRAIDDGWLDDYRILAIGVTSAQALEMLRELDPAAVVHARAAPLRTVVVQTALARAAAEFGLRRVLVFTPRVRASREFARTLPAAVGSLPEEERPKGRLTVGHVDGTQSTGQRHLHLRRLADPPEDGWTVLSNSRCLGEGVDVPAVDAVVFTAPKESQADVIQAVGRALRRNPAGSGIATILLPVLLPDDPADTASDLAGDMARWATLLQTLRALRAHDSGLAADLDHQRTKASTGAAELPPRLLVRLPDGYAPEQLLRQLTVRVLEETTSDWMVGYGALRDFHTAHGHTRVPTGHVRHGVRLDRWAARQRADHKAARLDHDQVAYLNALGFDWAPRERIWPRGLACAQRFHAEHGHLRVPHGHLVDGVDLYGWLWQQRTAHRAGTLPADRVAALDALGIDWTIRPAHHDGYAAAQQFHAEHGHLNVPYHLIVNGVDLYNWLATRRVEHRKGRLSADRVRALEALGIQWSIREAAWQRNLASAAAYHQREGHLHPRKGHREGEVDLSRWLSSQRTARRDGTLTGDQIAALDAIGMHWEIPLGWGGVRQVIARRDHATPNPDREQAPGPRPAAKEGQS
ncbi:Helicase conserved C-terminal domain-containing protein [Micromonospora pallida]|uniref:Helicase conserved C-terminal domain-containing protein n=1 Tax=Micromonospora pallida TaxID=145854 RepID=A0A1C6RTS9_9ACTN|nr:DEAD/DEAH box helicase [Micromonospora pallida]SCL20543.1 Helicase conserved C-terminal domain-containing protein [Micromonospora pallida]